MKPKFRHAFVALNYLCLTLPYSFALPVGRERTPVLVSGSLEKILTTSVDSRTFDDPVKRHKRSSPLSKRDGTWIVQAGDTGNGIAARLSIQFTEIASLNQGVDWNNLQIGQILDIPFSEDSQSSGGAGKSSSFYTVVAGDTGNRIAARYGISFDQLSASNPGVNWYDLQIGQILIISGQHTGIYIVVDGDTGNRIAARYGISFDQLSVANPGVDWYDLYIGQVLIIPAKTSATSTTTIMMTSTSTMTPTTTAATTSATSLISSSTTTSTVTSTTTSISRSTTNPVTTTVFPPTMTSTMTSTTTFTTTLATTSVTMPLTKSLINLISISTIGPITITDLLPATNLISTPTAIPDIVTDLLPVADLISTPTIIPNIVTDILSVTDLISTPTIIPNIVTDIPLKHNNPFLNPISGLLLRPRAEDPLIQAPDGVLSKVSSVINAASSLPTTGPSTITVRTGDTAVTIATRYGISLASLAVANPQVDLSSLKPGQTLKIPTISAKLGAALSSTISMSTSISTSMQATVNVKPGDTITSIAAAYGISVEALTSANAGVDPRNLKIGQVLNLPNNFKLQATISLKTSSSMTTRILPITSLVSIVEGGTNAAKGPQTYTVKAGDTGTSISAALGFPFSDLDKANPGVVWTNLQIGQILNLPSTYATIPVLTASASATAPAATSSGSILNRKPGTDIYLTYSGPASNLSYPAMNQWMSFSDLWNLNQKYIGASCSFASGSVAPNTPSENAALKSSILSVSASTGVNPSFILALVMQESNGCVRVPTTSSWEGIQNPGLLQSFKGNGTCDPNGQQTQPCPISKIIQMLMDGIAGSQGVGIVPALKQAAMEFGLTWSGGSSVQSSSSSSSSSASASASASVNATNTASVSAYASASVSATSTSSPKQKNIGAGFALGSPTGSVSNTRRAVHMLTTNLDEGLFYYMAARIYNSGSLPSDLDLSAPTGSTRCYVSDVVNRLLGWVTAPRNCTLN